MVLPTQSGFKLTSTLTLEWTRTPLGASGSAHWLPVTTSAPTRPWGWSTVVLLVIGCCRVQSPCMGQDCFMSKVSVPCPTIGLNGNGIGLTRLLIKFCRSIRPSVVSRAETRVNACPSCSWHHSSYATSSRREVHSSGEQFGMSVTQFIDMGAPDRRIRTSLARHLTHAAGIPGEFLFERRALSSIGNGMHPAVLFRVLVTAYRPLTCG